MRSGRVREPCGCRRPSRGAAAAILCLAAGPALAQPIHIPAMPLGDALLDLARQSGRNILFSPANVAGAKSKAVRASDFDDALRRLVAGTPLKIVRHRADVVELVRPPQPPAAPRPARPARAATPRTDPAILVTGWKRQAALPPLSPAIIQSTVTLAETKRLPDRTMAEVLGRVPGVLTLSTSLEGSMGGIDRAGRAEGDFIAARGLYGGYIQTRIDGIGVPENLPYSRGTELGLLPANGFARVTVIKTLDASQAGAADAVVIDISNPVPRDPAVRGLHIYVQGALDQQTLGYHQDGADLEAGLSWAGSAGQGRLTFAIGADYRRRAFAGAEQTYQAGNVEFAVSDAQGHSPAGLDPARNLLLTSLNAQLTRGVGRDIGLHGGIDFEASDRLSLFARFNGVDEHVDQDVFQIGFQGGRDPSYIARTPIGGGLYRNASIRSELHYWYETNPEDSGLAIGQLGARWRAGRTGVSLRGYIASGWAGRPDHLEISFWDPQGSALDGGLTVRQHGIYPVPALSARDHDLTDAIQSFPVHDEGEEQRQQSHDTRWGGDLTVQRQTAGRFLRSWEAGLDLLLSRRSQWLRNTSYPDTYPAGTTLGESGLASGSIAALLGGVYDYRVPLIDDGRLDAALHRMAPVPLSLDDRNANTVHGREQRIAAHISATWQSGDLLLKPGLRVQRVHIANRYWRGGNEGIPLDGITYGWNRAARTYDAVLPSLIGRWQATPRLTVRAAFWTSQTQPSDHQLAGGATVEEQADGTRAVEQGNPRLKAVNAGNLDLAVEWRGRSGMMLSAALFAKRLTHYLYDMGSGLGTGPSQTEANVELIEPRNGGRADIAGFEGTARWPLDTIASALSGVMLGGQATLLDSRVHLRVPALDRVERAQYAPGYDVMLTLAYRHGAFAMDAALHRIGAYVQDYGLNGVGLGAGSVLDGSALDEWVRPSRQLDVGIRYDFGRAGTLRLTVRNILNDLSYRATLGRYSDTVPETVTSGRLFGLRYDRSL